MQCIKCKRKDTQVIDSREAEQGKVIRRRRRCPKCNHRFTTFERMEMSNLLVKKKDGSLEPYSREKLEHGVWIACGKRPVSEVRVERMISGLEEKWRAKKSISSQTIGEDVVSMLKKLDHIAYIRFASVYRSFKDVEEFKHELGKLLK
ncbi:MAG: transcriptional regulator NrdR [Candidatus Peregrinibacteria bacterium]